MKEIPPAFQRELDRLGIVNPSGAKWKRLRFRVDAAKVVGYVGTVCQTPGCNNQQVQLQASTLDGKTVWVGQCPKCHQIDWTYSKAVVK